MPIPRDEAKAIPLSRSVDLEGRPFAEAERPGHLRPKRRKGHGRRAGFFESVLWNLRRARIRILWWIGGIAVSSAIWYALYTVI